MTRLAAFATVGIAALLLASCGFRPLYGTMSNGKSAGTSFAAIYVPPIDLEHTGYALRNDLLDDLQASATVAGTAYDLSIAARDHNQSIAITNNQVGNLKEVEITRWNYTLIANYQLVDRKTRKVLSKGQVTSLSGYDVVQSPYATEVALRAAQTSTAEDVSQQLRLRLAVYFDNHPADVK
jgi:LPS-assembly lipoprotein